MGGRTAYLDGVRKYYTVKEITDNIKVIKLKEGVHNNIPFYSITPNRIYVNLDVFYTDTIKAITAYDGNRELKYRIDFVPHKELKGMHIHTYVNGREVKVDNLNVKEKKFVEKILKEVGI
ncbi:MAG: hypothetical protein LBH55_03665 [Mycoplasmataceae bacterium]|jgi:hypothetical protein|nr:hypothetical protein [Mycoplasmataceae bacterium]